MFTLVIYVGYGGSNIGEKIRNHRLQTMYNIFAMIDTLKNRHK